MMHFKSTKAGIGALVIAAAMLSGCVVTARPAYGVGVVAVAPPAPQVEVIPAAPGVGFVWLPGYWNWEGGRHVWIAGHYEHGRPGYHWVAHHWVEGPRGGWHLEQGHWAR